MPSADEAKIKGFSWGGLLFIILLSIFVCIITFKSAVNYSSVLDNDDSNLPDTRGTITFYLWLNVIVGFVSLYIFILFGCKLLFGNKNPYQYVFQKALDKAVALGDLKKIEDLNNCKAIGLDETPEQCDEFNNLILKSDKVAYYLEKSRYMSDKVNETTDIYENVYERMCQIKEKAIDCIKNNLETSTTKNLYRNGGVPESELEKAKKITIENIKKTNDSVVKLEDEIADLSKGIPGYNTENLNDAEKRLTTEVEAAKTDKDTKVAAADVEGATQEVKLEAKAAEENYTKLKKTKETFNKYKNKKTTQEKDILDLLKWDSKKSKRK